MTTVKVLTVIISFVLGACLGGYIGYKQGLRLGTKSTLNILREACNRLGVKEEVWKELHHLINNPGKPMIKTEI